MIYKKLILRKLDSSVIRLDIYVRNDFSQLAPYSQNLHIMPLRIEIHRMT